MPTANRPPHSRRSSAPEIALAVLGIVTVGSFFLIGQRSQKSLEQAVASERVSSFIVSQLGEGHVELEDHLAERPGSQAAAEVLEPLDRSLTLCLRRMNGGSTQFGTLLPAEPRDGRRIERLCEEIEDLRRMIEPHVMNRIGAVESSGYEAAFDRVIRLADTEVALSARDVDELDRRFNTLRFILVTTIFALFIVGSVILRRHLNVIHQRTRELEEAFGVVESALEQAKRFERLRGDMVANISHELRTPLVPILGWSQFLSRSPSVDAATVREYSTTINRAAERLSQIIENLLQVAQGPQVLRMSEIKVATITQAIDEAVRSMGRILEISVEEGSSVVTTDRKLLISALTHIADNAIKFSPPESKIELQVFGRDGEAVFSIIDQGPGFPSGPIRDFELFTQGEGGTTRDHGGMGTGLFLASALAKELGGYLEAASEPGRGGRVSIVLSKGDHVDG